VTRDDRLRIAVFIDFDNIEIGVKNTLGGSFDAGLVLEALKERGEVVSKTAYSDWQRAGNYSRGLTQHAIKMVQRNLTPGGDKNGADINLALDALEMAFTHPHINAFVIVGGDSDFISLVEKLKQYDKKVFVVGGRQFSSLIMQKNCHEFIAYENLVGSTPQPGRRQSERGGVRVERLPIEQALPLVMRGLKVLSDREVSPQLGLLKSTLLQLDSTFSERTYGAGSFRDFVEKLEKAGVVSLTQGKGGWLVTATEGAGEVAERSVAATEDADIATADQPVEGDSGTPRPAHANGHQPGPAPASAGSNGDGVREFARLLAAGHVRRWPMYLRNVKQLLRQVDPKFDERAYGFGNLADLLRAAGRDGIVRVDRDRQGVIRVFQGSAAPAGAPPAQAPTPQSNKPKVFDIEDEMAEIEAIRAANLAARGIRITVPDDDEPQEEGGEGEAPSTPRETLIAVDEASGAVTEYVIADDALSTKDDAEETPREEEAPEPTPRSARSRTPKRASASKGTAKARRTKKS
jgi:uncharacterized LabA/DUF88 family protein